MSVIIKPYGNGLKFRVEAYVGITDITAKHLATVDTIVKKAFIGVEDEIEKQLYKEGLMTCNAMLCSIAEMREYGGHLVQAYIKQLDEKYKEEQ